MMQATKVIGAAALFGTVTDAAIPNVKLNNGVEMPMMSFGTWQYDPATAEASVKLALKNGFNHIDTARSYNNQDGVGNALKGVERSSYFLTTKVQNADYDTTKTYLADDMTLLGLNYVDLMLVHYPPKNANCKDMQGQWRAMEEFYKAGKAKAIGVSNYCESSLECIAETWTVVPAVNQIQFHVGMGTDPTGLKSYCDSKGIVAQAYSPLGNGDSSLITGELVTGIGKSHNATGAQVSMRWLVETGVPFSTKTTKESHMQEDVGVFDSRWPLQDDEKSKLDEASAPAGSPSFMCSKMEEVLV